MNTSTRFREAILNAAGGAALYGARVYAKAAPLDSLQGEVYIVIDRISTQREAAHDGDGRLATSLMQLTIGGPQRERIEEVKDFLIEALHGKQYESASGSIVMLLIDDTDRYEPDARTHSAILDFQVIDNN